MAIPFAGLTDKLKQFLADQSWRCDADGPSTCQLIGFRGCRINTPAQGLSLRPGDPSLVTDHYDDVMLLFGNIAGGSPYLGYVPMTANPGLYWTRKGRCPSVQPGQYKYMRGPHSGHNALRQADAPVCVIRDLNRNGRMDPKDLFDYPVYTGINIHAGGLSENIGRWSGGCQVIPGGWDGAHWLQLYHRVYGTARQQKIFHYTLVDFAFFVQWDNARQAGVHSRHILYGSFGPAVHDLRVKLGVYGDLVDGEWGPKTDRAVRKWQRAQGQVLPSGIVRMP